MTDDNDPRTVLRCPGADRACFHRMGHHLTTENSFRLGAEEHGSGAGPRRGPGPLQILSQDTRRIRP